MPICKKCHDIDKAATGCDKDIIHHPEFGMFRCTICGKYAMVYVCPKHNKLKSEYAKRLRGV